MTLSWANNIFLISREKRLIVLLPMLIFLTVLVGSGRWNNSEFKSPSEVNTELKINRATLKLKNGSGWSPHGWGSGVYLNNLPKISAGAVINYESGEVIWSMNIDKRVAPASLSKLATVMTAIDIASDGQIITVDRQAAEQNPTKLGLKEGEKLQLEEAVSAAILTSANDATEAITQSIGGELGNGTETFMDLVNVKLEKIGAYNSHFTTSTGLDSEDHFSTVYDLAIIAENVKTNYPIISQTAAKREDKLEADSNHKLFDLPNWNALLGTYPGVDGLKIGYTEAAGNSTIVTAERNDVKLISIVIGADSIENRERAAAILLNYGFSKFGISEYPVDELNLVGRFEEWRKQLSLKREN